MGADTAAKAGDGSALRGDLTCRYGGAERPLSPPAHALPACAAPTPLATAKATALATR